MKFSFVNSSSVKKIREIYKSFKVILIEDNNLYTCNVVHPKGTTIAYSKNNLVAVRKAISKAIKELRN